MLLARVLTGARAARGQVCACSLLLVLIVLVPLANASPPDPLCMVAYIIPVVRARIPVATARRSIPLRAPPAS